MNGLSMTLQSTVSSTGVTRPSPEDVAGFASSQLNGNPSTCTNLTQNVRPPTNSAMNTTAPIQHEDRESSPENSGATSVVDANVGYGKNCYARINQTLEGLSLTSGSEIPTGKRRFREREHIYAQAVRSAHNPRSRANLKQHRRHVLEDRKRLQEELRKELYKTKRRSGEQDC